MRRVLVLIILLGCLPLVSADAATRLVVASGGAASGTCLSTACTLTYALTQVQCGDTISVGDGAYTFMGTGANNDGHNISSPSCTISTPILFKAANLHGATLQGNNNGSDADNHGPAISAQWWIVEGFRITQYRQAMTIPGNNIEVRHNLFYGNLRHGIYMTGDFNNVHHNVFTRIQLGDGFNADPGGMALQNAANNTIRANWFWNISAAVPTVITQGGPLGQALQLQEQSDSNLIQGNLFFDHPRGGLRLFGDNQSCLNDPGPEPGCVNANDNIVRDNIVMFQQGGSTGIGENATDTLVVNNFSYAVQNSGFISTKGNVPGGNDYLHNTVIATDIGHMGVDFWIADGPAESCSRNSVFRDNVIVGLGHRKNKLMSMSAAVYTCSFVTYGGEANYNLVWADWGTDSNWQLGYTYGANDIHNVSDVPVFIDAANGNFTLADGSPGTPGNRPASDAGKRGATFNSDLRADWVDYLLNLPTVTNNVDGLSGTSFSGLDTTARYQVWGYLQPSNFTGVITVTTEGNVQAWTVGTENASGVATYISTAPNRWIYMTTVPHNGTLDISWDNNNTFDQIRIRRMPTPEEGYAALIAAGAPTAPSPPANLRVVSP